MNNQNKSCGLGFWSYIKIVVGGHPVAESVTFILWWKDFILPYDG
jgi:hypothetical protein